MQSRNEQCWRYHNTWLQTILQSHSNTNSIVVARKQTQRPKEQTRRLRNKSTQLQPPGLWQRSPNHRMEKRQSLQQILQGILDIYMQKTQTRSLSFTLYKYQLEVDQRLYCKAWNCEITVGKNRESTGTCRHR
jgi:hypothetical protein